MSSDAIFVTYSQGSFPILNAQFTTQDGISPGVGTMTIAPEGSIDFQIGDLVFGIGDDDPVTFKNVFITDVRQAATIGSNIITLTIQDARWCWQFNGVDGGISGAYNVRKPDNSLDSSTEKKPQELATMLIQKLKFVDSFDISKIPNDTRPEVDWDYANPAQALADLCDKVNCRICYQPDNTLQILPYGDGKQIDPSWPAESLMQAVTIEPAPDKIRLVGAKVKYQIAIPLDPVAKETSGAYVPLSEASYKPADGWGYPESLDAISDTKLTLADGTKSSLREIALGSVYRCFRIRFDLASVLTEDVVTTPSGTRGFKRQHILPLPGSQLVETYTDSEGVKRAKDAFVSGVFWHKLRPSEDNSPPGTKCELPFSVDPRIGVLRFPLPVYIANDGEADDPILYLHIAVNIRDPGTRAWIRYSRTKTVGSLGAGEQIIRQEDVQSTVIVNYKQSDSDPGTMEIDSGNAPTKNTTDCDKQADYYLTPAADAWNRPDSAGGRFRAVPGNGFPDYQVDGAIQQITYSAGPDGCNMSVSRGYQHDLYIPPYKARREKEQSSKSLHDVTAANKLEAKKSNE